MVVVGSDLARELRRRRVGRRALVAALDQVQPSRSTWLPGDLHVVPTSYLVLAAFSMTRPPAG